MSEGKCFEQIYGVVHILLRNVNSKLTSYGIQYHLQTITNNLCLNHEK